LSLCGCAHSRHLEGGAAARFTPLILEAPLFAFDAQLKIPKAHSDSMIVYIEGDGHAVSRSGRINSDPTPYYLIGWLLARQDTASAVLYLARLGQ